MDGYCHSSQRSRALEKWRVRLELESLEARDLFHVGGLIAHVGPAAGALAAKASGTTARVHQPPRIIDFTGIEEGPNEWTFEGRVVGDNISGLVVQLGGIPSLEGQTATTDSNGWFQITVQLNPREHGTATAQTTDQWGQSSNTARTPVDPTLYPHEDSQRSR